MKAIVIHQYGGADLLKLESIPDPRPRQGEVLVRLAATSVNPIDIKIRNGSVQAYFQAQFPLVLGRDAAGTVVELGPGVSTFKVGDRVMALTNQTYAEFAAIKVHDIARIPDGLDTVQAGALPLVTLTGEQLITRGVKPSAGQTILVTGAVGSVGRTAVYALKQAGAKVIAGVRTSQIDAAKELGVEDVISLEGDEQMKKHAPYDSVADAVGHETAAKLLGMVRSGGTFASTLGEPSNRKDHPDVNVVAIRVVEDGAELEQLAKAVVEGKLHIPIGATLPLEKMAEAHHLAEKGAAGKVLITIG